MSFPPLDHITSRAKNFLHLASDNTETMGRKTAHYGDELEKDWIATISSTEDFCCNMSIN